MSSKCFCTIVTANYLPYALALYDSISAFDEDIELKVLISDAEAVEAELPTNVEIHTFPIVCADGVGKSIKDKYQQAYHDAFRWSMKPVYMNYLLSSYERVIYVDCDIQFTHSFDFLFDLLNDHSIVLSPHFRSSDPKKDRSNFFMQYYSGLYNGGFVGANRDGYNAMEWWANACFQVCEKNPKLGQFDDQTHLNLLPIFFDKVHTLKNRGCNVANWNQLECERVLVDGNVMINKVFPVVFIHFTKSTILGILRGDDELLQPYLETYDQRLIIHGRDNSLLDLGRAQRIKSPTLIDRIKRKIKGFTKFR